MNRWFLLSLVVLTAALLMAGCAKKEEAADDGALTIGFVYNTLEHPFYQAFQRATRKWCQEYGLNLIDLDGKSDPANMSTQIENLVAQKVDGIVYCLVDAQSAVADIKYAQENNIPIISYAIRHGSGAQVPFVGLDEFAAGQQIGEAAAKKFQQVFPGVQAKMLILREPRLQATEDRANGFTDAFKKELPSAVVVGEADGGALRERAMAAMEDLIQSHPEANVGYGINGDSSLGALAALEGAGRGGIDTFLLASHDGSEPEILKLIDPKSSLKISIANLPQVLSKACVDTILDVINGKISATEDVNVYVPATILDPAVLSIADLQRFLTEEYSSNTDLQAAYDQLTK
ncbi:MAG: sugar ABC transporter substrate-binding protein [Spirochaetaceae bacterium]|jgi:ribose transport system substrate-binding protein|nr:sugar ABC transporter substrate-binding protein [Spirochaetaceae bacterium]